MDYHLNKDLQKISTNATILIQAFEGCKLKSYKCPSGVWTIGYGHTSKAGEPEVYQEMEINQREADRIFLKDIEKYEREVRKFFSDRLGRIDVEQSIFDMAVSFHYNTGAIGRASWAEIAASRIKSWEICRECTADGVHFLDFVLTDEVKKRFMAWNKSNGKIMKGLVRRRQKEWEFMNGFFMGKYQKPMTVGQVRRKIIHCRDNSSFIVHFLKEILLKNEILLKRVFSYVKNYFKARS